MQIRQQFISDSSAQQKTGEYVLNGTGNESLNERENGLTQVDLAAFPGIRIGQTEDTEGGSGITVVLCEDPAGMAAGLHIGGGGPACRETGLLDPVTTAQHIHAAVLGGGSAFGLDAAGGVMRYLEEKGIGVEVRGIHVPLVTQVDIFDLPVGDPRVRPDQRMGYEACRLSEQAGGNYQDGCHGAGCGATIGKYAGGQHAMKSGIGSCVLRQGDLMVGAIVAVNAFGDIYDWKTGQKTAGAYAPDGRFYDRAETISFLRLMEEAGSRAADSSPAKKGEEEEPADFVTFSEEASLNTTIGIVFTNAPFRKPQLCKIAAMAHDGFARSIFPVHTSGDGDSIIALSIPSKDSGKSVSAGIDTVGSLAACAASEAILRGVRSACSAYGYKALKDMEKHT